MQTSDFETSDNNLSKNIDHLTTNYNNLNCINNK